MEIKDGLYFRVHLGKFTVLKYAHKRQPKNFYLHIQEVHEAMRNCEGVLYAELFHINRRYVFAQARASGRPLKELDRQSYDLEALETWKDEIRKHAEVRGYKARDLGQKNILYDQHTATFFLVDVHSFTKFKK